MRAAEDDLRFGPIGRIPRNANQKSIELTLIDVDFSAPIPHDFNAQAGVCSEQK